MVELDDALTVLGTLTAPVIEQNGVSVVVSANIDDAVVVTQAAYNALGAGRPAGRLYLVIG